jgi:beta-lactamase regulating signal transducer with metallopeptidase domain
MTWGLLRPVVVFPERAETWPEEQLQAALAHEQAHIERRDWAVHIAAWAVASLFWFNPLLWLARGKLAREAEHAADDAVLAKGVRPSDYASLLVSLTYAATPRAALGVSSSLISQRVHAVLEPRPRSARRWPVWVLSLLLLGLALPALGAWPTWAAPQDTLTCK